MKRKPYGLGRGSGLGALPLLVIVLLAVFSATMIHYLVDNPEYYQLDGYTWETEDFRKLQTGELIAK